MEIFSSWALFIVIMLLIAALFTSYMLQQKKVEAIHETVLSIFAGKLAGYCTDLSNFPRHDRRPYSQNQLWNFDTEPGELQLPDLLHSPPTTHYPSIRLRTTSGELLSKHWIDSDVCVRGHIHLCRCAWVDLMDLYSDSN